LKYKLKKEVFFEDGNSVGKSEVLHILSEDLELGMVKLETISEDIQNVKKIFWTKKENLKQVN
tara:strand:+ start:481 stop:669 length:189 start_codon:yes stop_codon:yes gene_type:complete